MAESSSKWFRDLLIIPLIVGAIMALFAFGLPTILEKDNVISYSIDGPITYLDQLSIGDISIKVDDVPTTYLFSHKVRIWNSGDVPIKDLPIRFIFDTDNKEFKIFNINHSTKPAYEFGKISLQDISANSKRFTYELLNPDDEDIITFLTNSLASLSIYTEVLRFS